MYVRLSQYFTLFSSSRFSLKSARNTLFLSNFSSVSYLSLSYQQIKLFRFWHFLWSLDRSGLKRYLSHTYIAFIVVDSILHHHCLGNDYFGKEDKSLFIAFIAERGKITKRKRNWRLCILLLVISFLINEW